MYPTHRVDDQWQAGRMASAGTGGEHGQAGADSYLRSLVDQLRSELEEGAALLASERQRWRVDREADRLEARDVANALRVELESSVRERNAAVQAAAVQAADEVAQLKATIDELRSALESVQAEAKRERDLLDRRFREEREQLQGTISALRTRMEMTGDS
jgi:hypothetical protein